MHNQVEALRKTPSISAIILSGGRATRMNGVDKGLISLQHKPLIQHVIDRLAPQVDEILINANREIAQYEALHFTVLQDDNPDFIGPLAGFSLGLQHCKHDYLLTVPCDSPMLPLDLASRLLTALVEKNADIAVARSGGFAHPVFCLMKKSVLPSLQDFIDHGERKVSAWQKSLNSIEVLFDDCDEAFVNLNTFEEHNALALKLAND
jgi:molybdopterin-guanine dinucleotide biosynthesis protein A